MDDNGRNDHISLAELAERLGLAKGTVSAVLNNSPHSTSIPQHTKDRIWAAARQFNYRPNYFARSLRNKKTYTVGVLVEEIGDPYGSEIISGIDYALGEHRYFYLTVSHRHTSELLQQYCDILCMRGVEGIITIDTILENIPDLPTVAVAGHRHLPGVTNIVLDHVKAADMIVSHLFGLGHQDIAVIRGQEFSADSEERFRTICAAAERLKVPIRPELTIQLVEHDLSSLPGYRATKQLLSRNVPFTALLAYNDRSCFGAVRAIREAGLRVPEDISVVGFDDIRENTYHVPPLTTIRQPLRRMGEMAAETLVSRIEGWQNYPDTIAVEPEFIVRGSTAEPKRALAQAAAANSTEVATRRKRMTKPASN
jgi:DNA-binding LacI/PurR family transcriptional regulator